MLKLFLCSALIFGASVIFSEDSKPVVPATPPVIAPTPPAAVLNTPEAKPVAPANPARQSNQEWSALLDRLRSQPRSGDIVIGLFNAPLVEIFAPEPEIRAQSATLAADYQKALVEKGRQFEAELKALRTDYDARIVAVLPEAKRDAAQKLLELAHNKWTETADRDSKIRAEFTERLRGSARPPAPGIKPPPAGQPAAASATKTLAQSNAEATAWMSGERVKAMKQDDEALKAMRGLLAADDAARFDRFNHAHFAAPQPAGKPPGLPPVMPKMATPQAGVPPSTTGESKKDNVSDPNKTNP